MSKFISWVNVICLWSVIGLVWCLSTGTLSKDKAQMVSAFIMFTTAYNVSDMIGRYLSLRSKDR